MDEAALEGVTSTQQKWCDRREGRLCCWASGDRRIHCSNHSRTRRCLDSLQRKHSHLSTQPLFQHKYLSLSAAVMFLGNSWGQKAPLFNLIISPCFSHSGFPGRLAISPANFPTEGTFNCIFLLQIMQFSCLQEFHHVELIFYLTWNLHPALCWVSAGSRWVWVWADRFWGCLLSGLYRKLMQGLLHPSTASG